MKRRNLLAAMLSAAAAPAFVSAGSLMKIVVPQKEIILPDNDIILNNADYFTGSIDEIRFTKEAARYPDTCTLETWMKFPGDPKYQHMAITRADGQITIRRDGKIETSPKYTEACELILENAPFTLSFNHKLK